MKKIFVRSATINDIQDILGIYAYYVLNSVATFEEVPPSLEDMIERFNLVKEQNFPYLVLIEDGIICGYTYASKFHSRSAYRFTAENTVYIKNGLHGKGYGKVLMFELINNLRDMGIKNIIAHISNPQSIIFHKAIGFREVGTFEKVGFKFNKWIDTTFMQLKI